MSIKTHCSVVLFLLQKYSPVMENVLSYRSHSINAIFSEGISSKEKY